MKTKVITIVLLAFLLIISGLVYAEEGVKTEKTTLWFGSHYTDFSDNSKKIGEYNKGENELLPEFRLYYLSTNMNSIFRFTGHYYDDKNIFAFLNTKASDKFNASVQYRSMVKQESQDLLANLEAREWLPASGTMSGKMLTHEIFDPNADYSTDRKELLSKISLMLTEKNKIRFEATHRMILKTGTEQSISSTHCFSCHMTSQTQRVDNEQQQFEAGLDGEVSNMQVGYRFGYRSFSSKVDNPQGYYDDAKHPVNGGSGGEFGPRMNYDDGWYEINGYPKTEKISHKVKFKKHVGKGYFAGALGYSKATNKGTDLATDAYNSSFNYAALINPTTRYILKAAYSKYESDSVFVDLPTYREGLADSNYYDFDFTRYSIIDRKDVRLSGEIIKRINNQMTGNLKLGYDIANRDNYPVYDDGISTKKFYAQGKFRYRKGLKYNTSLKVRFEKIADPFVSGRGLFEKSGYGDTLLDPLVPTSTWVFYFQREALRYQDITTQPTQVIDLAWQSNWTVNDKVNMTLGFTGKFDKNADLDSLDVKHTAYTPSLAINIMPNEKFSMNGGVSYQYNKSKLPVTVALFDG